MGIISGSVSFQGRIGDHLRAGYHFGGILTPYDFNSVNMQRVVLVPGARIFHSII